MSKKTNLLSLNNNLLGLVGEFLNDKEIIDLENKINQLRENISEEYSKPKKDEKNQIKIGKNNEILLDNAKAFILFLTSSSVKTSSKFSSNK